MDNHGLDRMVLIASLPGDEGAILEAVRAFPQRIIGYFMLDPTKPDAAERTLTYCSLYNNGVAPDSVSAAIALTPSRAAV